MRRGLSVVLSAAVLSSVSFTVAASGEVDDTRAQQQTLESLRTVMIAVEAFFVDYDVYPDSAAGWVELEKLDETLGPYLMELPATDGWAHPIMFWSDKARYVIVSPGRDGEVERDWSEVLGSTEARVSSDPDADIVAANFEFVARPEDTDDEQPVEIADTDTEPVEEPAKTPAQITLDNVRTIALAMSAFSLDNDAYPGPTDGWVEVETLVETLSSYQAKLPLTDGWGHSILIWSNRTSYVIVSPGSDGEVERDWSEVAGDTSFSRRNSSPEADIVHSDGVLIAWP